MEQRKVSVYLAVNHAFAFDLPVVTQTPGGTRYHSPEVAYVRPGENGMLSEFGNVTAMVEAVQHILMNQDRFSTSAFLYAREHLTIDRMVDGLEAAVRFLENANSSAQRRK